MGLNFGLVISLTIVLYVTSLELCEEGWIDHGESCFTFITGTYHWQQAEDICRSHKSNLASIHTIDRQIFITRIAKMLVGMANFTGYKHNYWLGAKDYFLEGEWRWIVDGKQLNSGFTNWETGHPLKSNITNCVYYSVHSSFWYNSNCNTDANGALCEKSINLTNAYSMYGFGK